MKRLEIKLSDSTFKDEDGNNTPTDFLNEMLDIAIDESDFIKKVTYGCTNENYSLDEVTENNLHTFYRKSK